MGFNTKSSTDIPSNNTLVPIEPSLWGFITLVPFISLIKAFLSTSLKMVLP
jgi:hypothetical protein